MTNRYSILDLPYDLLFHVCSAILDSAGDGDRLTTVLNLSLACKQLRASVAPVIFRNVIWPMEGIIERGFYPQPLLTHIKRFTFTQTSTWRSRHEAAILACSVNLPNMRHMTTFVYSVETLAPSRDMVASLAIASSHLNTLDVSTAFLTHDAADLFPKFSPIDTLIIRQPERITMSSAPEDKRALSIACAIGLLQGCQAVVLELPGEYFPLKQLATRELTLPTLKRLVLTSYPPIEFNDYPIWKLAHSLPRLSVFEIRCRLRVVGATRHRYELFPSNANLPPSDSGVISILPGELRVLMFSNPSLHDRVFRYLPHTLRHLVMDFIPDWENMLSSGDSLAYHEPPHVLAMLDRMQAAVGASGMPNVDHFCLKMGWCVTTGLLERIRDLFPRLRILEFEGIRYFQRSEVEPYMDACIDALASLENLHTLKLALELREDPYDPKMPPQYPSVRLSTQRWGDALSKRLCNLKKLAFETRPHTGRTVGPQVLIGNAHWIWFERGADGSALQRTESAKKVRKEDYALAEQFRGVPKPGRENDSSPPGYTSNVPAQDQTDTGLLSTTDRPRRRWTRALRRFFRTRR